MLKLSVAHVAVHARVHGERLHVSIVFANLLDLSVEISDEWVASALHEPQFEVAVSWEQVLIGRSAALEVSVSEEREFHAFLVERGDGYVKRPEIGSGIGWDEDDAVGGEVGLRDDRFTVPLSYFLPKLSIFTSNSMLGR